MHRTNCLNCNASLNTDQKYCNMCGQRTAIHRLSFHDIWHDVVHYFTHADKGIFLLIKELVLRPGVVAREFLAGRRARYFKPLNFFLIVAGLLVFMTKYFHVVDESRANRMEQKTLKIPDPVKRAKYMAMIGRMRQTDQFVSKYSNVLHMLATPIMAFLFWLFYRKGRYTFIEHLVANMYFVSLIMLFYALVVVPVAALSHSDRVANSLLLLFFLIEITYRGFAYYQLMNRKGAGPLWKAIGVSFITVAFWAGTTGALIGIYIQRGF